jgi:hypothetical protein
LGFLAGGVVRLKPLGAESVDGGDMMYWILDGTIILVIRRVG